MKRTFLLLLALLCAASMLLAFSACDNQEQPDKTPDSEQTETPDDPPVPMLDIVKDGKTDFRIIRSDFRAGSSDSVISSAIALRKAIVAATGVEITMATDWDDKDDNEAICEIIIGESNRAIDQKVPTDMDQYTFLILNEGNKVLITGGSDIAIERGVKHFIATYLGYDEATDTYAKNTLSLPLSINEVTTFDPPPFVYLIKNIQSLGNGGNNEDANDIVRFYTTLQGRLNKNADKNNFYVYQMFDSTDQFWLDYISAEGKLLDGYTQYQISTWDELWEVFSPYILDAGIVVWDPNVPATANVASTACSVDGYLPVRYDTDASSLYTWLTSKGVEVKLDLVDMFDGELGTTIADTDLDSSGSIKCDPYLWALEKYGDRVNPEMVAYVLDGASQVDSNPISQKAAVGTNPSANQLYNHDYLIYNECFFVDLTCKADEKPCDDPDQPMGTDAKTLSTILSHFQKRNNGKFGKLMGFPPWYMKYTKFNNWGTSGEVELEWAFVAFITQYDFIKEADAWSPSWMTNASVYCQYESDMVYENTEIIPFEVFDEDTRYFTVYIGDYDSSAWLKLMVPDCFESSQRGKMPMMWAFNPNLSDRVPMIFDYVYENKTDNDFFVTGDSGAGYVFPSRLKDLDKWVDYNEPYLEKFDMDIVGFIIDDTKLSIDAMAAYAEIGPAGCFTNTGDYITVFNDETVFMRLHGSIQPVHNTDETREGIYKLYSQNRTNFAAVRTIRQYTTDLVKFVDDFINYAEAKNDGYSYEYVDMYTLFDLILQSGEGKFVYD